MWYVYILECQNGGLYTGVATSPKRRFAEHQAGDGGHYTSYNRPVRVLYTQEFKELAQAEKREEEIKRWSRAKKLALIKGDLEELRALSKSRD